MVCMTKDPGWWSEQHESTWSRLKSALRRDWEQTKADFTRKAKRPPAGVPNEPNWDEIESSYRYGVGARRQFEQWDEGKLDEDWTELKNGRSWTEVKSSVRHAWDYDGRSS